jgi:SAM-dependent methyltransferase
VRQDERTPFDVALRDARPTAYAPGEYIEQENFMRASEILELAQRADIVAGSRVLDLCCGVAGPGRFIARETSCHYRGIDFSETAIDIARARAGGLDCTFDVALVPPLPDGTYDVVLLLETMLAFADKRPLLSGIRDALADGGRFAFTLEEGAPLTAAEGDLMPDADTVWLTPLPEMLELLDEAGLQVIWQQECSDSHRAMADALADAFEADASSISAQVGQQALDELVEAHRQWSRWLASGRVRKFAFVAEKASS